MRRRRCQHGQTYHHVSDVVSPVSMPFLYVCIRDNDDDGDMMSNDNVHVRDTARFVHGNRWTWKKVIQSMRSSSSRAAEGTEHAHMQLSVPSRSPNTLKSSVYNIYRRRCVRVRTPVWFLHVTPRVAESNQK